jgi:PPM family protein phosphatase
MPSPHLLASRRRCLPLPRLEASGLSHVGRRRRNNEDAHVVDRRLGFFAVADGVGGHAGGEIASHMAIEAVHHAVEDAAALRPIELGASLLAAAVEDANTWIHASACCEDGTAGMATTFTGLLVLGDHAVLAHVGDSRAYLLRGRQLRQLTEDHTLVNAYLQAGILTPEDAGAPDLRNMLLRALGLEEAVTVDTRAVGIAPGDTFLLASDGLHGVVADDVVAAVLLAERDPTRAAAVLIGLANDAGGPDNITVVLVRVG